MVSFFPWTLVVFAVFSFSALGFNHFRGEQPAASGTSRHLFQPDFPVADEEAEQSLIGSLFGESLNRSGVVVERMRKTSR